MEQQEPSLKPIQSSGTDVDDTEMEELVTDSFLRLSPPPSERDYYFHLDENEGLTDLFDMPISSFWLRVLFTYFVYARRVSDESLSVHPILPIAPVVWLVETDRAYHLTQLKFKSSI